MRPRLLDLSDGSRAIIDSADTELVAGYGWYRTANGYVGAMTKEDGKRKLLLLHRLLMGEPARPAHVDHISGDKLDNRRANLRVVSPQANQANRRRPHPRNTSGVRGVGLFQGGPKWRAQIVVDRKVIHLGLFDTLEAAAEVRRAAEISYWGEACPGLGS